MSIKHPSQERKLFIAVHETYVYQTSFAYKIKDSTEASNFMDSVPLILSEWYNTVRTWIWFTDKTDQRLEGYKWTIEKALVNEKDTNIHNNLVEYMDYERLEDIEIEGDVSTYKSMLFAFLMDNIDKGSVSDETEFSFQLSANK